MVTRAAPLTRMPIENPTRDAMSGEETAMAQPRFKTRNGDWVRIETQGDWLLAAGPERQRDKFFWFSEERIWADPLKIGVPIGIFYSGDMPIRRIVARYKSQEELTLMGVDLKFPVSTTVGYNYRFTVELIGGTKPSGIVQAYTGMRVAIGLSNGFYFSAENGGGGKVAMKKVAKIGPDETFEYVSGGELTLGLEPIPQFNKPMQYIMRVGDSLGNVPLPATVKVKNPVPEQPFKTVKANVPFTWEFLTYGSYFPIFKVEMPGYETGVWTLTDRVSDGAAVLEDSDDSSWQQLVGSTSP